MLKTGTDSPRHLAVVMDAGSEAVRGFAVDLAGALGAAISSACVVPPALVGTLAQAEVRYDLAEAETRDQRAQAKAASDAFARTLKDAGIAVEAHVCCRDDAGGTPSVLDIARLSDLILIQQPEPDSERASDAHLKDMLLESGRPCLLVPYAGHAKATFGSILVAWDHSAPAARALADALPFLRRASRVEVVHVARDFDPDGARDGARILAHLAAHGIAARHRTLVSTQPFAEAILSHMADAETDLLVMGAYGHPPLLEALVGGASRDILRAMTVPVLMAH